MRPGPPPTRDPGLPGAGRPDGGGARGKRKKEGEMGIDAELLEILACPKCKGEIRLSEEEDGLICDACKLKYPIRDDIPVMLIEEAEKIA